MLPRWVRRFGAVMLATMAASACGNADAPARALGDESMLDRSVSLYFAADTTHPPRAVVFFFGNDIGFWQPHRRLAALLARSGFAVAGFDVRGLLRSLPSGEPTRDSAFAAAIDPLIARARHALGGDSVPLVIAGHSLGAEVAIWTAAHARPPGTVGVLAMSPGSRSHLRVSVSDIMNGPEPTGPESFSVAGTIAMVPDGERIAIVRGTRDDYARADPGLLAAGGGRITRFSIPLAGHSLKRLITAGFETRRALAWLLDAEPCR